MSEDKKHKRAKKEQAVDQEQKKQWSSAKIGFMMLFIIALLIPYIHYSHKADNRVRKAEKLKQELKDLRAEFITLKSEIVGQNKQSDVAKKLKGNGLEVLWETPFLIPKKKNN